MLPAAPRWPGAVAALTLGLALVACSSTPPARLTPEAVMAAQWRTPPEGHLLAQSAGTTSVSIEVDPVTLDLRNVPALEQPEFFVAVTCTGVTEAQLVVDGVATGTASCGLVDGGAGFIGLGLTADKRAEDPHTFVVKVGQDETVAVSVLVVERAVDTGGDRGEDTDDADSGG